MIEKLDSVDRKMLDKFRASAEGLYTLEYARTVKSANPKGQSLIPQVLLGSSYNGLRQKVQKLELPTRKIVVLVSEEQALVFDILGRNLWLRPLLNLILADLVDWSKYVASGKSLKTKEALAISSKIPASMLSLALADRVEKAIGSNPAVQKVYKQLNKTLLWKDMQEMRILNVCSIPRKIAKPKTAAERRLKRLGYRMMDAAIPAPPIHRFKKKEA